MHLRILVAVLLLSLGGTALAQTRDNAVPSHIGNRANGLSYQPTPGQVRPREQAAGVAPSAEQQKSVNDELFRMDAHSLKAEGLGTGSVPGRDHGH